MGQVLSLSYGHRFTISEALFSNFPDGYKTCLRRWLCELTEIKGIKALSLTASQLDQTIEGSHPLTIDIVHFLPTHSKLGWESCRSSCLPRKVKKEDALGGLNP